VALNSAFLIQSCFAEVLRVLFLVPGSGLTKPGLISRARKAPAAKSAGLRLAPKKGGSFVADPLLYIVLKAAN